MGVFTQVAHCLVALGQITAMRKNINF